jgi:TPR repeat protein
MILSNLLYTEITGVYLFASTNLPAAAFLGLLLLMTDPSTSPRTNVGRTLFGLGYGFGYVVAFEVLGRIGAPELYAKLYPVPILNCTIQILDRLAKRGAIGRLNDRWENGISKQRSNAIHIGLWSLVFGVMIATSYVPWGKRADHIRHPGDSIAFWKAAVADNKYDAERKLIMVAGTKAVAGNSPEAFNELAIIGLTTTRDSADIGTRRRNAAFRFAVAAEIGYAAASKNVLMMSLYYRTLRSDNDVVAAMVVCEQLAAKRDALACYLMGLAFETGGGVEVNPREALALYQRCPADYLFAQKGIVRIGLKHSGMDLTSQAAHLQKAAAEGDGESCYYLAYMHQAGKGVPKDVSLVQSMMKRAVDLGFEPAIEDVKKGKMQPFKVPRPRFMAQPDWASGVQ